MILRLKLYENDAEAGKDWNCKVPYEDIQIQDNYTGQIRLNFHEGNLGKNKQELKTIK